MAVVLNIARTNSAEEFLESPTEERFRHFFVDQAPKLILYFRSWGCESGMAEELAQDVLLTVFRQVGKLRDKRSFQPWMYRIARNAMVRRWKKEQPARDILSLEELDDERLGDMQTGSGFGNAVLVSECLDSLAPRDREIMTLRYLQEMEYHEIAEVLGMQLGTVQWKVFEIRKRLAARLTSWVGRKR